jgi:WD40 repeat protein
MAGQKNKQTTGVGADPTLTIPLINCFDFMPDGKSLVTGWSDGHVRSFLPQSGKLFYLIKDAHKQIHLLLKNSPNAELARSQPLGVTCCKTTEACDAILTGGSDGEIHVYSIGR